MGLLSSLRVRLALESEDFRRGIDASRKKLGSFSKDVQRMGVSGAASARGLAAATKAVEGLGVSSAVATGGITLIVGAVAALVASAPSAIRNLNEFDNSQRKLAASAKLSGVNLQFLQSVSADTAGKFRVSADMANDLTVEMAKLSAKAGDVGKSSTAMAAFLDIGAARGLNASQTLQAVKQAILGIDEGTDKLFNANPSVLYKRYADAIGTTVGKLTDQQKAQALLNAALQDGQKVQGEYAKWLDSAQGKQASLGVSLHNLSLAFGRVVRPILSVVIPALTWLANTLADLIDGFVTAAKSVTLIPDAFRLAWHQLTGDADAAAKDYARIVGKIDAINSKVAAGGFALPTGDGSSSSGSGTSSGASAAKKWVDDFKGEWENLRHQIALKALPLGQGSNVLAENEQHALALLDIEERHAREKQRLGDITKTELDETLRQLDAKRALAKAEREYNEAVNKELRTLTSIEERSDIILNHRIAMAQLSGDAAIQALGSEHRVSDELQIQLATIDKIYKLRRDALVSNKELSDAELANAMLRLDLERKRDKEKAKADAKAKGGQTAGKLSDLALSIGSDVAQGRGVNVASLTASLGAIGGNVLGNAILPGIGGKIGAVLGQGLGGLVGGIFGHHDTPPVIKSLSAVERAQRETITAIEQQTKDLLLAPQNRFINLPSSFTIPAHRPSSGNTGGDTFNVSITVPVTSGNPADIQHAVELAMGNALTKQRNRRVRF